MTTADDVQAFADNLRSHDGDQMAADMLAAAAKRIRELERAAGQVRVSDQPDTSAKIDGSSPVPAAPTPLPEYTADKLHKNFPSRIDPNVLSGPYTPVYLARERISDLERQLAEALVDAERWRWGVMNGWPEYCPHWEGSETGDGWYHENTGEQRFDSAEAAIDAARRKP